MKKIYISVALLAAAYAQAQVGFGTSTPHKSAQIDIDSKDKGLLMPRVELVSLTNAVTPINTPAEGLLVYNTKIDTTEQLEKGFYVWEGTTWKRFATQNELEAVSYWKAQATSPSGGNMPAPPNGSGAFNVQTFNNTIEPVDVDIYQKGKVGIGYNSSLDIDFAANPTQKQLEIGGDFRTVHTAKNKLGKDWFFGIETNSLAMPLGYNNGNLMYTTNNNNIADFLQFTKVSDGNVFVQDDMRNALMSRKGTGLDFKFADIQVMSEQIIMSVSDGLDGGFVKSNRAFLDANQFFVMNVKDDKAQFGIDFAQGKFYIGDNTKNFTRYYFPNAKGTDKQILQLNATQESLEWKNPLDVITPGSANQVLVTNPAGTGVTWVDQSSIVPTTTVSNALSGSSLTTTVNGVDATPIDLGPMIQAAQKLETVSAGNGITVTKDDTTTTGTTDYNVKLTAGTAGQILTTQTVGAGPEVVTEWKNLADLGISSTPKFFYMPSIVLPTIPTDSRITANGNYTVDAGVFTVKLYELFKGQFTSPVKSSSAISTLDEFVKVATGYDYFVTYADEAVFTDITLDANGLLTYKVNPNAIVRNGSFMNIVLKVK